MPLRNGCHGLSLGDGEWIVCNAGMPYQITWNL